MRKRKGALLRISIEIETTKKSLFYLLAQSVSVYPTSNVGTLVKTPTIQISSGVILESPDRVGEDDQCSLVHTGSSRLLR